MAFGFKSPRLGTAILVASLGLGSAAAAGNGDDLADSMDGTIPTILADDSALGSVGEINLRRSVLTFREASALLQRLQARRKAAVAELAILQEARTATDIGADIATAGPAGFDGKGGDIATLARLRVEQPGAVPDRERPDPVSAKRDEARVLETEIAEAKRARAKAWQNLTRGRGLSPEALTVLKEKLAMD